VETTLIRQVNWKLTAIWLVLAGLALIIGLLKYSDRIESQTDASNQAGVDERSLLPVSIEQLNAIEIVNGGALHRFERDEAGAWFYHAHGVNAGVQAPHGHVANTVRADQIAYAFGALGRARIERELDSKDHGQYGVTRPETLLLAYGDYGAEPVAQYAIGDVAPDTQSHYVLIVDRSQVVTIATYQIENLMNLIQTASNWSGEIPAGSNPTSDN
jgi:hypothetical protein